MNEQPLPIVLIVDDEIMQLRMISSMLARTYCPFPVSSGKEALRVLENLRLTSELWLLKAIILDIMMPEMDGLALLETIRQRYPKDIPVFMCSALGLPGTILRSQMMGANDFILKPFSLQLLREKLASLDEPTTSYHYPDDIDWIDPL
jgi:CheY-like chemotaxis protein